MADQTSDLQRQKAIQVKIDRAIRRDPATRQLADQLATARARITELEEQNAQYHHALHAKVDITPAPKKGK